MTHQSSAKMFDAHKTRMTALSNFDTVPECDGQVDGRTELLYQYLASALLCWHTIKMLMCTNRILFVDRSLVRRRHSRTCRCQSLAKSSSNTSVRRRSSMQRRLVHVTVHCWPLPDSEVRVLTPAGDWLGCRLCSAGCSGLLQWCFSRRKSFFLSPLIRHTYFITTFRYNLLWLFSYATKHIELFKLAFPRFL